MDLFFATNLFNINQILNGSLNHDRATECLSDLLMSIAFVTLVVGDHPREVSNLKGRSHVNILRPQTKCRLCFKVRNTANQLAGHTLSRKLEKFIAWVELTEISKRGDIFECLIVNGIDSHGVTVGVLQRVESTFLKNTRCKFYPGDCDAESLLFSLLTEYVHAVCCL